MKRIAPFLVLMAGILWGMIGIFVRRLNAMGFGSLEIVTVRAIATTILLFLYILVFDRRMFRIHLKDFWCFLGTGIVSIVFFNFCYFKAITMTSLSVAAILLYTAPTFVMIMSAILFREKITAVKVISLLATFVGCILVTGLVGTADAINPAGILVGLGAGVGYALYSIFSRYALERGYHSLTITFYTFLLAMVGTLPMSNHVALRTVSLESRGNILFCVLFGLVSTVVPYLVYTLGLNEMENGRAAIIASVEPVTATLLGVIVYQEELGLQSLIGIVLVLGAIMLCNVRLQEKE